MYYGPNYLSPFAILNDEHEVVQLTNAQVHAGIFDIFFQQEGKRQLRRDIINGKLVSTVFLGCSVDDEWFETVIFADNTLEQDLSSWKYKTYNEAIEGHETAIELVKIGALDGFRRRKED